MLRKIIYSILGILFGLLGMLGVILLIETHYGPAFTIFGCVLLLFGLLLVITTGDKEVVVAKPASKGSYFVAQVMIPGETEYGDAVRLSDELFIVYKEAEKVAEYPNDVLSRSIWYDADEQENIGWAVLEFGENRFAVYPESKLKALVLHDYLDGRLVPMEKGDDYDKEYQYQLDGDGVRQTSDISPEVES